MILHCVFCNFKDSVSRADRTAVLSALSDFACTLEGVAAFEHGPNRDFEMKSPDYSDGFVIHFTDKTALDTYASHPTHLALGARLCDLCNGGPDGILVFDLETSTP